MTLTASPYQATQAPPAMEAPVVLPEPVERHLGRTAIAAVGRIVEFLRTNDYDNPVARAMSQASQSEANNYNRAYWNDRNRGE